MWATYAFAIATFAVASNAGLNQKITIQKACDGFDKACTIELTEGLDQQVFLSLDEPIICPACSDCDKQFECSVVVNFTAVFANGNNGPPGMKPSDVIEIEDCYVRWNKNEYQQSKAIRVKAKTSYRNTGEKVQIQVHSNVVTRAEYYMKANPGDLFIETVDRGTAQCTSVGDPHYTSFDGKYWNFYDSGVTTLYRAIDRDFAIMTRTHINSIWPSNSVNCEIGGREGKDRVLINFCGGNGIPTTDFNSDNEQIHPVVENRGNTYQVYFASGAYMDVSWAGHYMNIDIGGVDTNGRSCGLCGDADGNPNNDKAGDYRQMGGLDSCSKVPSIIAGGTPSDTMTSVFDWKYDPNNFKTEVFETPEVSDCPYEFLFVVKPMVSTDNIEDITEAAERLMEDRRKGANTDIVPVILDDEGGDDDESEATDYSLFTDTQLLQACKDAVNGEAVQQCTSMFPKFGDLYVEEMEGCVDDLKDMRASAKGNQVTTFLSGVNNAVVELCITFAIENGAEVDPKLTQVLCNGAKKGCGGHGSCDTKAACVCDDGWAGVSCTVDLNSPPSITGISDLAYDVRGLDAKTTPSEIVIYGTNFHKSQNAVCRFGSPKNANCGLDNPACWASMEVPAFYAGATTFICYIPTFEQDQMVNETLFRIRTDQEPKPDECEAGDDHLCFEEYEHSGAVPLAMNFAISNDGSMFSEIVLPFSFYDSKCLNCTAAGKCVERTSGSCIVGEEGAKQCYLEGESDADNQCLECQPSVDPRSMIYSFSSSSCKPKFSQRIVRHDIIGAAKVDDVVIKSCSSPDVVEGDYCVGVDVSTIPDATIEYYYSSSAPTTCLEEGFTYNSPPQSLAVNKDTGEVTMITSVDTSTIGDTTHALDHPCLFSGSFTIKAKVTTGTTNKRSYVISAGLRVVVDLLPVNTRKIPLPEGGFQGTIEENAPDGAPVKDLNGNNLFIQLIEGPEFEKLEGDFKWIAGQQGLPGAFAVNKDTGAVTVRNSNLVDREATGYPGFDVATGVMTAKIEFDEGLARVPDSETVTITITNVNERANSVFINCTEAMIADSCSSSAVDSTFSLPENTAVGTLVGELDTIDAESVWDATNKAKFSYSVNDPQQVLSAVQVDGVWMVKALKVKDFEQENAVNSWKITVVSVDSSLNGADATISKEITVTVVNVDEGASPPAIISADASLVVGPTSVTIATNAPQNTVLGTVQSIDPDANDGNGECSGVCGVWTTGFVRTSETAQEECPFEVTPEGHIMRRPFVCVNGDRTDLAFKLQCTFESNNDVVESAYNVSFDKIGTGEPTVTWEPAVAGGVEIIENVLGSNDNARSEPTFLGKVLVTDPNRPLGEFLDSDFTVDYPELFQLEVTNVEVDGVKVGQLTISLKEDAFVNRETFECEGCYIVDRQCDTGACSDVAIGIKLDDASLGECSSQINIPVLTVIDVNDVATGIECVGFDDCSNVVVTENAQSGTEVVRFNIIDEDPSIYTVTLTGTNQGFGVMEVPNGNRRRGLSAQQFTVFIEDVDALIADAGNVVNLALEIQEEGVSKFSQIITISVLQAALDMVPTFSSQSPMMFKTSQCGSQDQTVTVGVEKIGINATEYPESLAQYQNNLVWSTDLDWVVVSPNSDTVSAVLSVDYDKFIAAGSPSNAVLQVTSTETEEFINIIVDAEQYAPKFGESSYVADVMYSSLEEETGFSLITDVIFFMPPVTAFEEFITDDQQRMEISVVVLEQAGDFAEQSQFSYPVFSEDSCQANRFVTSTDQNAYNLPNPLVWKVADDFADTDCLGDFETTMTCTIKYSGTNPATIMGAGAFSPSFTKGLFLKATWKDPFNEERSKLNAFVPFFVNVTNSALGLDTTAITDTNNSEQNTKGGSSSVGLIVGIVMALLLLLLIAGIIYFRHQKNKADLDNLFDGKGAGIYDQNENAMYSEEPLYETDTEWQPGVSNPMYAWYRPNMSRKECSEALTGLGDGAFIVRDSESNKNWHMLGVKSENQVVHDKIRFTENQTYQLLPSIGVAATAPQPTFDTLPELVGHYEYKQNGMSYKLEDSDPIYDNHNLMQERTGTVKRGDTIGSLPQKSHEYAPSTFTLAQEGDDSVGNPMYFSNDEPSAMYSQADGYLDVNAVGKASYLDVNPN